MKHYYENVRGLGNVAVSRHAQANAEEQKISEDAFARVLLLGRDTPDGMDVVWREAEGIRLVILLKPEPFKGAVLVKTAFRIKSQAKARN